MAGKNPMEILRKEHDIVLKILDRLEEDMGKGNISQSEKEVYTLEKEFDKHSLNKEEKALFPEIEKFIPREGGPTGMMVIEHEDLVESIKNFKGAAKEKSEKSREEMGRIGAHIISLLRQHIDKENSILFMMAEMHLDDKQKNTILKKFEEIDSKKG